MNEHVSVERMNESLDGLLSAVESEPLMRHLDVCAECRNEYARLSETLDAVKTLSRSATPPSDAWAGIEARISAASERAESARVVEVYPLPTTGRRHALRISLSVPQLAAAAAVVAFFSALAMWMAIGGGGAEVAPGVATTVPAAGGPAARAVAREDARYSELVDQLERILAEGRGVLTPETLVSIEASLRTVDAAIAEIEAALANDPSSALLSRLLANHQRTKLGVLQRAAAAVQAQT